MERLLRVEWLEDRRLLAGTISGTVWHDLDANGIQDFGDDGAAGFIVFLDHNRDGDIDTGEPYMETWANGYYEFTGLAPGAYNVAIAPRDNWQLTSPNTRLIGLGSNAWEGPWVVYDPTPWYPHDYHAALWEIDPETGHAVNSAPIILDYAERRNLAGLVADPSTPGVYYALVDECEDWSLMYYVQTAYESYVYRLNWPEGSPLVFSEEVVDVDFEINGGGGLDYDPVSGLFYGGVGSDFTLNAIQGDGCLWSWDGSAWDFWDPTSWDNVQTVGDLFDLPEWCGYYKCLNDATGDFAFDGLGNLYWGQVFSYYDSPPPTLRRVDKNTAELVEGVLIVEDDPNRWWQGMEWDPNSNDFFVAGNALGHIDPTTAGYVDRSG